MYSKVLKWNRLLNSYGDLKLNFNSQQPRILLAVLREHDLNEHMVQSLSMIWVIDSDRTCFVFVVNAINQICFMIVN